MRLRSQFLVPRDFSRVHQSTVIAAHDAFVLYRGGILLVKRSTLPLKDEYWCLGRKITRRVQTEESLKVCVERESGLTFEDVEFLGVARTLFQTDPLGHGKGTDTLNLVYTGRGKGELRLDLHHKELFIVSEENYTSELRKHLHPYVRYYVELLLPRL